MDNYYLSRIDLAEWMPGANGYILQALDNDTNDLIAEISIDKYTFWSLPGDTFEESDLEDDLLEKLLNEYSELQGD